MAYFAASIDRESTNRRFAESLELDYPILSDPDRGVARAYGVLRKLGMHAARATFYIGKDGTILDVDYDVKPGSAGEDVARKLEELGVPRRSGRAQGDRDA